MLDALRTFPRFPYHRASLYVSENLSIFWHRNQSKNITVWQYLPFVTNLPMDWSRQIETNLTVVTRDWEEHASHL
jgi:hypothetical protein